ncbi:MAG: hypothetical protein HYZ92_06890 [Candidatus Omnitrophica bacterium]|nr:hypothetical protein [Candidatus Omnitrophota bacterium]
MSQRSRRLLGVLAGLGLLSAFLIFGPGGVGAQSEAKHKADLAAMNKKLDDVLATQQRILAQLDAMMEELSIVKVRCTR